MVLTEEEWRMVYAAMKIADAIVLEVTLGGDTPTSDKVILWRQDRVEQVLAAKEELRTVSEVPHKWKKLMEHFHGMFAEGLSD